MLMAAPHGSTGQPAIRVRGVDVRYGRVHALDDVDLDIAPGRITGLIGANGSGKSTLYKAIMGLLPLDHGDIEVCGGTPDDARKRSIIGYVPQNEAVDWDFPVSVRDVVMMGRGPRRPRKADRDAVASALERVGMESLADRRIGALSGGQRKRVFVARALAQEAKVLLLDEPFAGVDRPSEEAITRVLKEFVAEPAAPIVGRGAGRLGAFGAVGALGAEAFAPTVVISTHDLGSLPSLCDDVALIRRSIIARGPASETLTTANLAKAFGFSGGPVVDAAPGSHSNDIAQEGATIR